MLNFTLFSYFQNSFFPISENKFSKSMKENCEFFLNLNCGFGLLIFTTFVAFKTKFDFHSIFHAYYRLG